MLLCKTYSTGQAFSRVSTHFFLCPKLFWAVCTVVRYLSCLTVVSSVLIFHCFYGQPCAPHNCHPCTVVTIVYWNWEILYKNRYLKSVCSVRVGGEKIRSETAFLACVQLLWLHSCQCEFSFIDFWSKGKELDVVPGFLWGGGVGGRDTFVLVTLKYFFGTREYFLPSERCIFYCSPFNLKYRWHYKFSSCGCLFEQSSPLENVLFTGYCTDW